MEGKQKIRYLIQKYEGAENIKYNSKKIENSQRIFQQNVSSNTRNIRKDIQSKSKPNKKSTKLTSKEDEENLRDWLPLGCGISVASFAEIYDFEGAEKCTSERCSSNEICPSLSQKSKEESDNEKSKEQFRALREKFQKNDTDYKTNNLDMIGISHVKHLTELFEKDETNINSNINKTCDVTNLTKLQSIVKLKNDEENLDVKISKHERNIQDTIKEMIKSEECYVEKLNFIKTKHVIQYKNVEELNLFSLVPQLFSSIEELHTFHFKSLLPNLRDAKFNLSLIGDTFCKLEKDFLMYTQFYRSKGNFDKIFKECEIFWRQNAELNEGEERFAAYLVEPVLHLPRYILFLEKLRNTAINLVQEQKSINESQTLHFEKANESLEAAILAIERVLRTISGSIAIDNIIGCPLELLEEKELIRDDEFLVTGPLKRAYRMRCFLFEKWIVLAIVKNDTNIPSEGTYEYCDAIGIKNLVLNATLNVTPTTFKITYCHQKDTKSYTIEGDSKVRNEWVEEILQLLWKYSRKQKEKILRLQDKLSKNE